MHPLPSAKNRGTDFWDGFSAAFSVAFFQIVGKFHQKFSWASWASMWSKCHSSQNPWNGYSDWGYALKILIWNRRHSSWEEQPIETLQRDNHAKLIFKLWENLRSDCLDEFLHIYVHFQSLAAFLPPKLAAAKAMNNYKQLEWIRIMY